MQFFPPKHENGKVIVVPPSEIYDEGVDCWKNALVGQFIGRAPNFSLFQRMAKTLWGAEGDVNVKPLDLTLLLFSYQTLYQEIEC